MTLLDSCTWWRPDAISHYSFPPYKVRYFILEASGNDAFFADYVEYDEYRDGSDQHSRWGRNGGNGYCLSTDSNDSFGSHARDCYRCLMFHLDGSVWVPRTCPNGVINHSRKRLRGLKKQDLRGENEGQVTFKERTIVRENTTSTGANTYKKCQQNCGCEMPKEESGEEIKERTIIGEENVTANEDQHLRDAGFDPLLEGAIPLDEFENGFWW